MIQKTILSAQSPPIVVQREACKADRRIQRLLSATFFRLGLTKSGIPHQRDTPPLGDG